MINGDDTKDTSVTKNSFIMLQNMRSLPRNFDEFNAYLNTVDLKPDWICLTENWLSEQKSTEIFYLGGYHPLFMSLCEKSLL